MAKSKIKKIADDVRGDMVSFNRTNSGDEYDLTHPDAISDGDAHGKSELGNKDDINTRNSNITKNVFTANDEYSVDD